MTSNHGSIANAPTTTARVLPSKRSHARRMHKGISQGGDYKAILPIFVQSAVIGMLGEIGNAHRIYVITLLVILM